MTVNDDLEKLIENLPFFLQEQLNQHPYKDQLIEIVLDLGRRPEARFTTVVLNIYHKKLFHGKILII
jgi:stage III sporulation protein SpoIIIAA